MKVAVAGTRGIPHIQGGVETHCEELFPRIAAAGTDVTLFRRSSYIEESNRIHSFRGVTLADIPTPRRKALEAIIHTFRAIIAAKKNNADLIHIHAIGPALLIPFAKILGLKTVMTNHGPDYEREKWGKTAKFMLRLGERLGTRYADAVIVISDHIRQQLKDRYGRTDTDLIFNGVPAPKADPDTTWIKSLGLSPGKYILAIGRFVPEKNFHLLIKAFQRINPTGIRLVIAGDADMPDSYSESLKQLALSSEVVLTGFIKGPKLHQLFTHARLFCLPSTHEGLPISLLEAMSYGLDVLVSDIDANKLPQLDNSDFFRTSDLDSLAETLQKKLNTGCPHRSYDMTPYDWDCIARSTMEVYRRVLNQ